MADLWDDAEPVVILGGARMCNGTVIAGGAVVHSQRCPMHGEPSRSGLELAEARGRAAGWADAVKALRDRSAASVVGRLLARTDGDANSIQIAAELADHLESIAPKGKFDQ